MATSPEQPRVAKIAAKPAHLRAGAAAEQAACEYLQRRGLVIVARNVRTRAGEIDLIARHHQVLVFVEVRWRRNTAFGGAAASLGWKKQQRLRRAAACYLQGLPEVPPCRLDALCLDGLHGGGWQWIQGI